ncbi:MAG: ABC transporter substrate-binding protein [Chloroflexi bacterium]|nr:ABC transporter substrate-binding protein [Chloroflexota bacterium]
MADRRVSMSIGIADRPSIMALLDGTVKPEGIDLTCVCDFPEPSTIVRHDRILEGELDGGELSMSFFVEAKLRGAPLIGLPVYPNRSFRHRSVYCRDGAAIKTPADLKGKKVGLHVYAASTMSWVRGILLDEYGVRPEDILWYTLMDREAEGARESGVSIELIPSAGKGFDFNEHIAQMMERGQLDAGVGPVNIVRPGISRLFSNFVEVETEYYRRTGIYPIIHTMVINERVVRDNPWVPQSLLKALREAALLTSRYTARPDELEQGDKEIWNVDRFILAGDYPYSWVLGEKERRTINTFLDYLVLDRVITSKPSVDFLFPII